MNKWTLETWIGKRFSYIRESDNTQVSLTADNREQARNKLYALLGKIVETDDEGFED